MKFGSPPAGSKLRLAEASESRVVMVIPPGEKRARGMAFFALVWLGITIPVGCVFLYAALSGNVEWEGDGPPPTWVIVPFISIFWLVGFGMAYVALKMKFESLMLCLEPNRMSLQRTFLGKKRMSHIRIEEHSKATLETSYSENDIPVYRIEIEGASRTEKFGTALQREEKQWIVDTINRFLGHSDAGDFSGDRERYCVECGTQLLISEDKRVCPDCGAVFFDDEEIEADSFSQTTSTPAPEDVAPEDIPISTGLRIDDDSADQIVVSFLLNPSLALRIIVGLFCTGFALFWMGLTGSMILSSVEDDGVGLFTIVASGFFCVGFGPLFLGMAVAFGRARITVNHQILKVRYHLGPLGWNRQVATDSVQDVVLGEKTHLETEVGEVQRAPMSLRMVKVETTEKLLTLTLGSKDEISRNLAGVVRYQIHRLGYRLVTDG